MFSTPCPHLSVSCMKIAQPQGPAALSWIQFAKDWKVVYVLFLFFEKTAFSYFLFFFFFPVECSNKMPGSCGERTFLGNLTSKGITNTYVESGFVSECRSFGLQLGFLCPFFPIISPPEKKLLPTVPLMQQEVVIGLGIWEGPWRGGGGPTSTLGKLHRVLWLMGLCFLLWFKNNWINKLFHSMP